MLIISSHHPNPRSKEYLADWDETVERCTSPFSMEQRLMVVSCVDALNANSRAYVQDVLNWPKAVKLSQQGTVVAFDRNHGHFPGFMLATLCGLRTAQAMGYHYVVLLESDVLCRVDFQSVFGYMFKRHIKVAAPRTHLHNMLETGLMFFNIAGTTIVQDFANALYENYAALEQEQVQAETVTEQALGQHKLHVLDWAGDRDEHDQVDLTQAAWLTHAREGRRRVFKALPILKMNAETGELEDDADGHLQGLSQESRTGSGDGSNSEGARTWRDDGVFA